ncbi:MAG TPA: hypothetical protein PKK00_11370 [Bacteroidales bacterium]|nr:hypothetical protein [Bacteroidales bacterium]HPS17927.1 hypothetical protein [Bacteroidales bacterium]
MSNFSFTGNHIIKAIKLSSSLLPGIEKIVSIYFCSETLQLKAKSCKNVIDSEKIIEDISIDEHDPAFDKIRKSVSYFDWFSKDDIPFEEQSKKKQSQMDVFQELEKVILALGFYNEEDKKNDILLFYFNKDLSNFGVSDSDKSLTSDHKKIIGVLLYNAYKTFIEFTKTNTTALSAYNENTKTLIKKLSQTKEELEKSKINYGQSLADLCNLYIKELSENHHNLNFILTDDALLKIKTYKGNITDLKGIIHKAIDYVSTLYFDSDSSDIYITEDYLNFDIHVPCKISKPQEVQLYDKYSKTILLLDKLETAAHDVMAKNMDITSANVGNACNIPITAPAISDAMKKHRNKIIHLLNKHPERWQLLRKEFRPVRNILSSRSEIIEKSA